MMENLKKVSRAQWCLFALLIGFAFLMQNCSDDDAVIYEENQTETELNAKPPVGGKVDVCRFNSKKGTYSVVSVVAKRVLEGDVILDADGDGYFKENLCGVEGLGIDCNDNDPAITRITSYQDADGDGYGNPLQESIDCTTPSGYVDNNLDCDDSNPDVTFATNFYRDSDNDTFGDPYHSYEACVAPDGYVTDNTDCDDSDITAYPGASEICGDNIDNNCDGVIDEGCVVGYTYVPDDNFEAYLEANGMGDGTPNNDYVLYANINTVTSLTVLYLNIKDLTGIEDFAALETLQCWNNSLETLDLSKNEKLLSLNCANNYTIKSIDVSNSPNLESLDCNNNLLTELNLGNNKALTYLACTSNQLTELDLSDHTFLEDLQCNSNKLGSLNVSGCDALITLYCGENLLTSIDISNNTFLEGLWIEDNLLTSIDVSQNTVLTYLECFNNTALSCIKVNSDQLATAPADPYWIKDETADYYIICPS